MEALALANDLYIHQIHDALDCKVVIDDTKQGSATSYDEIIIRDISGRSRDFTTCNFIHEFGNLNAEAHNLATHALSLDSTTYLT